MADNRTGKITQAVSYTHLSKKKELKLQCLNIQGLKQTIQLQ